MKLRKVWRFIWEEDSFLSWIVNIIIAIILVKFVIYPGLGLLFGTSYPVVAVISSSMEHNKLDFDEWWEMRGKWYEDNNIKKEDFLGFDFRNGFNKGDIMVLFRAKNLKIGDVIVYNNKMQNTPIIHRIVKKEDNVISTKGDNVENIQVFEKNIEKEQIYGRAVLRIPYLGWVKILFNDYVLKSILGGR